MAFWRAWRNWWRTSESLTARWLRAAHEALLGEMPILAAGTALFAILAVVPLLAAVVSVYGIVANPFEIHQHLRGLEQVLPAEIVDFLGDQLERQAKRSSSTLGLQLAGSVLVAMISARSSARALIDALNRAYRVREKRSGLVRLAVSLAMALGTLVGLMMLLAIVVALPAIIATLDLHGFHLVRLLRWPLLLGLVFISLLALYRFAPSPRPLGTDRHVWPGALVGTLLLVLVSFLLSQWVERIASYEAFYGAFGSVIVIVLWFYFSTMTLLIGGFFNAELERHAGAPAPDRSLY
jgi:membrane protein